MQGHRLAPMAFAYYGVNHNITATTANIAAMFACPFLYICQAKCPKFPVGVIFFENIFSSFSSGL
jgi:hypothetical protein